MRHAFLLGARLAWLDRGPARLRSSLVALAAAIGTSVLLAATGLIAADMAANPVRYADRGLIWLAVAVVLGVALPVLVLAATVGRLSAALRGRRLAALRLLGMSAGHVRVVAAVETGVAASVGSVLGVLLAWVLRPGLSLVPIFGATYPAGAIAAPWGIALLAVVLVPSVVVAVASLPERMSSSLALSGVRPASARRPSLWRALPITVGILWCAGFAYFLRHADGPISSPALTLNLVGSVTTLGLGVLAVVPVLVRLVGEVLLLGRSPATRIAARRIQAQPATMTRVVSGLLIGLFVVTGARCVVVAFESTPQYQAAERNLTVEQQAGTTVSTPRLDDALAELQGLPGVHTTISYLTASTDVGDGTCPTEVSCLQAVVMGCADLARVVDRKLSTCRDDAASWLRPSSVGVPHGAPDELTWVVHDPSSGEVISQAVLPSPRDQLSGVLEDGNLMQADVLLPPGAPGVDALASPQTSVLVLADAGDDLPRLLDSTSVGSYETFGTEDYDFAATLRALVWSVGVLVISLGLLSFGIAALDRAVERRREVAALQVVGVPAAVLRRAQWIEVAVPLVIGSLLAVAAGLSAGATYLTLDGSARLPWEVTALWALLGTVGGVAIGGVTVIAASPRLRPDLIRAE